MAEHILPIPNLTIPQNLFILSNKKLTHLHEDARNKLLDDLKADGKSSNNIWLTRQIKTQKWPLTIRA